MARLRFRDRFFTPPVARAMTSPLGILLAGAGASLGILAGAPLAVSAGLAAAAWAARVAIAIPRDPSRERIDPFTLAEPWRGYVRDALQAQARFAEAVSGAKEGPLRDRLREIGERLDTGVRECWRIARGGQALTDARRTIDVAEITAELAPLGEHAGERWAAGSDLARTADALQAQLDTAVRMDETIADAERRLRLLDAKLDEAVTTAIELSVRATESELRGLEGDVEGVVSEMQALRAALDETGIGDPIQPRVRRTGEGRARPAEGSG